MYSPTSQFEHSLQPLLNHLGLGVYRLSEQGVIVYANAACLRLLGITELAIAAQTLAPYFSPIDYSQLMQMQHTACSYEVQLHRADGSVGWVRLNQTWVVVEGVSYIDGVMENISDRKRLEQEREHCLLREQTARTTAETQRYRSTFLAEASRLLASSLDYHTALTNVAEMAVPILADFCIIDILENHLTAFKPPIIVAAEPEKVALIVELRQHYPLAANANYGVPKVLRTGNPELVSLLPEGFLRQIARDSEHLRLLEEFQTVSYMIVPLATRDRTLGAITLISTQPDRRYEQVDLMTAMELANRAAIAIDNASLYQTAQEANQLKDEFLAIVSHELRTPLNSILGWAQMLRTRKFNETLTAKAVETIERNARLQGKLIDDILDISRIIRGKLQLNLEMASLPQLISMAIDDIRTAIEVKNIYLETSIQPKVGLVHGDPARLQQIVWNLLTNAVKFTPAGGQIQVRLQQVGQLEPHPPGLERQITQQSYARITISDTGQGIDSEFLPYVFDRFRQADSTRTRSQGGLGLGLAIVRSLVEMHHGVVAVDSPGVGKGATFTVHLPVQLTSSVAAVSSDGNQELPDLSRLRVLVVDDDPDTRELVMFILQQCQADVTAVASADAGFQALTQIQPQLLISDISMPEEDGYAFIRRVRLLESDRHHHPLLAIALTAFARPEDRQDSLQAGFHHYLAKPVNPFELVQVISQLLSSQTGIRQLDQPKNI